MKVNGYEIKPFSDLSGANLSGANLYDAKGFDKAGIVLTFLPEMMKEIESETAPFRSVLHHLLEVGFEGTAELIAQAQKS